MASVQLSTPLGEKTAALQVEKQCREGDARLPYLCNKSTQPMSIVQPHPTPVNILPQSPSSSGTFRRIPLLKSNTNPGSRLQSICKEPRHKCSGRDCIEPNPTGPQRP